MPPITKIDQIVAEVATAILSRASVDSVRSEPTVDSQGDEALQITIVVKSDAVEKLKGDPALDIIVQIQDRLIEAGEDRFPIVEYATPEDLASGDDPES
jgi:hypothetical protein